ncbi:MAG: hypothetical protein IJU72_08475 [Bacteroidales bacterium]|nr:hypothetical protein [Bacteroidales bacterium]
MSILLIIFGIFGGVLLNALVGLIGARRRLGFGWTFLLSLLLTPLGGLICALLSEKLPEGQRRWGCLGVVLAMVVIVVLLCIFGAALGVAFQ